MRQNREDGKGIVAAPRNGEDTWEREDTVRTNYPFLFECEGFFFFFCHLIFNDGCISM